MPGIEGDLTNEVERNFISMSCLWSHSPGASFMVISGKIRGVIRCRKVLETVRSGRRAWDGSWSKIQEDLWKDVAFLSDTISISQA